MNVLFAESRDDDERAPGSEENLLDRTPSYRIQLSIYRQAADKWASMTSYDCVNDMVSAFVAAALFRLAGDDVKQRDSAVVRDRAALYSCHMLT